MQDVSSSSSAVLVTYAVWRTECARVAQLARNITHDVRLSAAVTAVTGEPLIPDSIGADAPFSKQSSFPVPPAQSSAAEATSSFFQWMHYNTPTNNTASPAASSVAPLPPAQETRVARDNNCNAAALLELLALAEMPANTDGMASSSASCSPPTQRLFAAAIEAISISIPSSLPSGCTLVGSGDNGAGRPPSLISYSHAILPMRETVLAPLSSTAAPSIPPPASAGTWRSRLGDADGEGSFDVLFTRLKHQAVERRRTAHAVSSSSCSTPSLTTASPPSAPGIKSGLDAARAALDVTDALLLRLRRQYRLSTSPSGRLAEAQTLLLRATVCREAQLYTNTILHAVNRRFKSDAEKQKKSHPLQEQHHCHPSAPLSISSSTLVGRTTPFWAALTAAKSRDPLIRAIRKELAHCTQRRRHNGRAGTTAGLTLPSISATPQFMDALARWRHVVEAQQRSLRMEEVEDYCSAAQLFLAAAVEEQQLGGGSASRDTRQPDSLWCESPLMLATHGVTQVLRACGLLLSDAPLEKEVPYPASLVEEMTLASLAVEAGKTDTVEDKGGDCRKGDEAAGDPSVNQLVLPPVLSRGNPHATRVWMRVVQLATLLERSALRLPWDTNDMAHDKADPTLLAGVSSTTQPLWEFSAAVLLHRPLDMVEVLHNILEHPSLSATTPVKPPSLRDLFRDHGLPSASNGWATQEVQAKPGTLPLCLLSLRRAIAAAVRAHHYAEALLDVEVGLHLLRGQEATLDPARSNERKAEPTADSANANKGKTNYERLVFWPEAASSAHAPHPGSTSVSTSKAISSALTYLSDSVSLIMMRVLLLFLTSPLASGEAAVRLQRRRCGADSWWKRETEESQASLPTSSAAGNASDQHEESGDGDSLRCAGGDVVRGVAVSLISALETLDTLTAQLQLLERHVIEPRCLATRSLSASWDAKCARSGVASAIPASEDVQLLPCIPSLEHRLEHIIVGTLRSAEADVKLSEAQMSARHGIETGPQGVTAPATEHGEVGLEEHAPSCAAEVNVSKQRCSPTVCKLTSSARYQQLKLAYRSRLSSRVGNTESSATCTGLSAGASSTIVGDTDDFHGDTAHVAEVRPVVKTEVHRNEEEEEEDGSRFGTQSSALVDLAQLVQELWVIVEALTLPLRTASTCTTPPTAPSVAALSASLAAGKVRFEKSAAASTGESAPISEEWSASESDISYHQARIALSTVEPRMQRCLRVLGARDRTVLSLLRRLQTELFTPTVCRSFALPENQEKN